MNDVRAFNDLLTKLATSWKALPDKPEETAEETLRALWYLAAGDPRCIERAAQAELPLLSETGLVHLNEIVEKRMADPRLTDPGLAQQEHALAVAGLGQRPAFQQ